MQVYGIVNDFRTSSERTYLSSRSTEVGGIKETTVASESKDYVMEENQRQSKRQVVVSGL